MTHRNNTILATFTERQPGIVGAALRAGRRRAADTSQAMSRRGAMAAAAELVNSAAARLIELAYETEPGVGLCNVDPSTGVLLVSVPWSSRTYTRYGLRRTEADCLALHMRRLHQADTPPLFTFDEGSRKWATNIFDYVDFGQAVGYWRRHELSAADYAELLQTIRSRRAEW